VGRQAILVLLLAALTALAGAPGTTAPAAAAPVLVTSVFEGTVSAGGVARSHVVTLSGAGRIDARLQWAAPDATARLSLARANAAGGWTVVTTAAGAKPVLLSFGPATAGRWRLQVLPGLETAAYTLQVRYRGGISPSPPFLTLLFSRTAVDGASRCAVDDTQVEPLDTSVAPALAARGLLPTGTVQTKTTQEHERFCGHWGMSRFASWDDLGMLRDRFGWAFVSHSRHRADFLPTMAPAKQWDETCGSLADLRRHRHDRGSGLFAYPNNRQNEALQASFAARCFAFGRRYGNGLTTRSSATAPPHWQSTGQLVGGRCNDSALPCAGGPLGRYTSPDAVIGRLRALANDQWFTLQTYLLVRGSSPGAWDCTAPNWQAHWTNDAERYCLVDYNRVLDAIPPKVVVTDPLTVAAAWQRTVPAGQMPAAESGTAAAGSAGGKVAAGYGLSLLPAPAGARWAVPEAIDSAGGVSGAVQLANGEVHAVVWSATGAMTDLTPSPGGPAVAYDSISTGTRAGFVHAGGTSRPTVWNGTTATQLTLPAGATGGHAVGVADGGLAAGDVFDGRYRAVQWTGGTPSILPGLGGAYSFATRVSAAGRVTGAAETAGGRLHAVVWSSGTVTDLGRSAARPLLPSARTPPETSSARQTHRRRRMRRSGGPAAQSTSAPYRATRTAWPWRSMAQESWWVSRRDTRYRGRRRDTPPSRGTRTGCMH
jgi:probable HAF family extracellular repeat protein